MKRRAQTPNSPALQQQQQQQLLLEPEDMDLVHHYSSLKELSKGFSAAPSSVLDETASNSSLASSSVSLSGFTSVSLSGRPQQDPSNSQCWWVPTTTTTAETTTTTTTPNEAVPISSRLAGWSQNGWTNGGRVRRRAFQYQTLSPRNLFAFVSHPKHRDQAVWEAVEDDLYILLEGRLDRLAVCRDLFREGVSHRQGPRRACDLVWSLALLVSSQSRKDLAVHDDHVSAVASFLSTGRDARHLKLAVVKALYRLCRSTPTTPKDTANENFHSHCHSNETMHTEKISSAGAEALLEFLTHRTTARDGKDDDEPPLAPQALAEEAMPLVYELRAKCLRNLDLERDRIRSVTDTGDSTAVIIATGAKIVELGIQKSNKAIEGQISNAGQKMKVWIDEIEEDENDDDDPPSTPPTLQPFSTKSDRDAVVVRALSGSTKRASEYAKQSSKRVAQSTVDTTLSSLYTFGTKVEESTDKMDQMVSPEGREMIKAAGKIGIASVGALALVAEAVVETTRSLSSKTAGVTADIVGHKYGSVAGEVARDAADTYTNVLETMGNITLASNGSKLIKSAAKTAGKNQVDEDVEKAKRIMLNLERQGAMVARHTLGIQWTEGSLTRELLCAAAASEDEPQESAATSHPPRLSSPGQTTTNAS